MRGPWTSCSWTLVALLATAAPARSQSGASPSQSRLQAGATAHWALTSARNVARARTGSDFAVNLDVRLPQSLRLRGEFGRSRFSFDGTAGVAASLPAERIAFTRLTASIIRDIDIVSGLYAGFGIGAYRYAVELSPEAPTRRGFHFVIGSEFPIPAGGLFVRLEAQVQIANGPYDTSSSLQPTVAGRESPSRLLVLGHPSMLVWGAGIGWRF